ncbi:hypothetical protein A5642_06865 [Mycolicibacterium mucogenicum]|uniref:Uncharacterized protein n=1 Tax=Mycolicibacterium mucogenicum TaxID=56689 RepID=A0A1A0LSY6_MYCMU|nr:hypothetical protein A5642_06865 [Mycolicibacterium mucogenicum]
MDAQLHGRADQLRLHVESWFDSQGWASTWSAQSRPGVQAHQEGQDTRQAAVVRLPSVVGQQVAGLGHVVLGK